jgi:hypothetical protein
MEQWQLWRDPGNHQSRSRSLAQYEEPIVHEQQQHILDQPSRLHCDKPRSVAFQSLCRWQFAFTTSAGATDAFYLWAVATAAASTERQHESSAASKSGPAITGDNGRVSFAEDAISIQPTTATLC